MAQEHAGSVRIADAENKAAAIKLEKDSLTRALPAERERHLLQLGRRRRELELEATSELSRSKLLWMDEEQGLETVQKALPAAKFDELVPGKLDGGMLAACVRFCFSSPRGLMLKFCKRCCNGR
ncbi:unnamed protein product [Symbiodinium natans]|uniref:Uncharacterized protein n=1 Tax=Symbiodinium natans TaxID=878477 RepID=A0A812SB15_9DINO|nr:unnamed protein product [Symbiodinium natans]